MPRPLAFALALALAVPGAARAETRLWTDRNIPAQALELLEKAQDLALDQRYDEAEPLLEEAARLAPGHPLCGVFRGATHLARIQDGLRSGLKGVPDAFFAEVEELRVQVQAQREAWPQSPYPALYLGAAYGMRGLARLYAGSYLSSYFDGKKGAALLREAVQLEPALYDAYMGLGQFEYYCGTLGSFVQFVLALPGDPAKGLEMLKTCGEKGSYAAWPCRAFRARLLAGERGDCAAAALDLPALLQRYPHSSDFARAAFRCLGAGAGGPGLRRGGEAVIARLEAGWKPTPAAGLELPELRLKLARACLAAGEEPRARELQRVLLQGPEPWRSRALSLTAQP